MSAFIGVDARVLGNGIDARNARGVRVGPSYQTGPMLTDDAKAILDFEARWPRESGRKADALLTDLGLRSTTFYQRLNRLLDDPDALAYAPVLVNRLRRRRATRRRVPAVP